MDNKTTISKIVELEINQKHINVALKEVKNDLIGMKNLYSQQDEMLKNIHYKIENQVLTAKKIITYIISITGMITACQFLLKWILK